MSPQETGIEESDALSVSEWRDKDTERWTEIRAKRAGDSKVLFDAYEPDTASEDALLTWVMKRMTEAARLRFDGKGEEWEDIAMRAVFAISSKLRAKNFPTHLSLLKYMGTAIKHFSSEATEATIKAEHREQPLTITKNKPHGDAYEVENRCTQTFRYGYRASPSTRAAQLCLSTQEQKIVNTLEWYGKGETQKLLGLSDNTMSQSLKRITARAADLKRIIAALRLDTELAESPGASRFLCLVLRLRVLPKVRLPKTFAEAVALGQESNGTERFKTVALALKHHENHYVTVIAACVAKDTWVDRAQMTWEQAVKYLLKLEKKQ